MSRTFEVPVIVTVEVKQEQDGTFTVVGAYVGGETPWPGSMDPCAWEPAIDEWHEGWGDDVAAAAWEAASAIDVTPTDLTKDQS